MTQATCKERIGKALKNHIENFDIISKIINEIDPEDFTSEDIKLMNDLDIPINYQEEGFDAWEWLNEYGLSLELTTDTRGAEMAKDFKKAVDEWGYDEKEAAEITGQASLKWCLSWGGPADYFLIEYTKSSNHGWWEITDIQYSFQDWFDGALLTPCADDYELMEEIIEGFIEIESFLL